MCYLPPEVARDACFTERTYFRMYFPLALEMYNKLFIDGLVFMAVDQIKKHILGLTQSNILALVLSSY